MSDTKRVPLQPLDFPDSLGYTVKKGEKGKQLAPSFRFILTLPESNEKTCPEYNYAQLLKSAEKKRRKDQKGKDESATNGMDPFDDDDDDDHLRDIAKHFEAKYGTTNSGKRKRHKYDDYVDLGAGYDENDSFIDNTDAYDEIVPEEVTTAHGGFYINCGALEFKAADGESVINNNNDNNDNDNDDEDESSEEEAEDEDSPKRSDKRDNSSSEDDDLEDIIDNPRKKVKVDDVVERKSNHESVLKKKKKHDFSDLDVANKRKNAEDRHENMENDHGMEDGEGKKKSKSEVKKFDIKKFAKRSSTSNGIDASKKQDSKKVDKVDAAIESVVRNSTKEEDESSRDTLDSGKSRFPPGSDSECDDVDKEDSPLPEGLPEDIKDLVNKLKAHGENSKKGKTKVFNEAINNDLLNLEKKLRFLNFPSTRQQVYAHLAHFLPCSKNTLVNRAKKLGVQDAENRVKNSVQRLKVLIDGVMPAVIEKYNRDCQRVADEKGLEGSPMDVDNHDGNDSMNKNADNIPRRRFPWTDETKKLVREIANARRHYFRIMKPRKQSMEDFVESFLKTEVLSMWPSGWVQLSTLMKYANNELPSKKKQKSKDSPVSNSSSVQNSNSRIESSNANYIQERGKNANPIDSSTNYSIKSNTNEIKHHGGKHKESTNNVSIKNDVSSEWDLAQQSKKFMAQLGFDLPSIKHDLSITPVNDYQKIPTMKSESKRDEISITPFSEGTAVIPDTHFSSQSTLKQIIESTELKNSLEEKDTLEALKAEKRKKKRERYMDSSRHKSHESGRKRKDEKGEEQMMLTKIEGNSLLPQLSKEEQEQRQIEETMAATNVLSQIINDCPIPVIVDDGISQAEQAEQEKDVQDVHMVMRSLKELQKLQERSSPSHSPMNAANSGIQFVGSYHDEYHRLYQKKEDKMRMNKKDNQW